MAGFMEYMKIRGQGVISDVNDTANNLFPVIMTLAKNTKLRISPEVFLKIQLPFNCHWDT
jgi:hypothetical protein